MSAAARPATRDTGNISDGQRHNDRHQRGPAGWGQQLHQAARFSLGPVVLDVRRKDPSGVPPHEKEFVLTQKKFMLLEYALRHRGEVCHRQSAIEQV